MEKLETDVLIIGAGAAGLAAAVAAARMGLSVSLIERNSYAGGKASAAIVGTICGLYSKSKALPPPVCKGFPEEFATKLGLACSTQMQSNSLGLHYLPYHPFQFKLLADTYLRELKVKVYYHSTVFNCMLKGEAIAEVAVLNDDRVLHFKPNAVVDCSGEGIISYLCNQPLIESTEYQAASQVFAMQQVNSTNESALSLALMKDITKAIQEGRLNPDLAAVSIVPGSLRNQSIFLKIALPDSITHSLNAISNLEMRSRNLVNELATFLKNNVGPFQDASIGEVASQLGTRTARRPIGSYVLTSKDVLSCKKSLTGISNGAWPIEFWEPGKKVKMEFFAENDFYQIPAECLIAANLSNLFFAGRSISADESAIASARVIGTCLQTGYAAGVLAAAKLKSLSLEEAIDKIRTELVLES